MRMRDTPASNVFSDIKQAQKDRIVREEAASAGSLSALYDVAVSYIEGQHGYEQNLKKGVQLLRKAAREGFAPAQVELGTLYYEGRGVRKNIERARSYFEKAAAQKNAQGAYNLATLYAKGEGVKKDMTKAIELYTIAADQDLADAQFNFR